jgi:uncharacterized phiE125 gp8 family phage protein
MLSPTLITPPASPITLVEAKAHLRVDHADDDTLIGGLIGAAVAYLDGWSGVLGRALEEQTWEIGLDVFPCKEIRLPLGPLVSVTSVKYTDPAGLEQTVDPADYEVDARPVEGWIVPAADFSWPATMDTINAVRVRWVAGTGCPLPVKHAALLLIAHWYATREAAGATSAEIPLGVDALSAPWRRAFV